MNNEKYNLDTEHRLTVLEARIEEIIVNHLPHLESKVDKLTWLLVTSLVGIISILIESIFK